MWKSCIGLLAALIALASAPSLAEPPAESQGQPSVEAAGGSDLRKISGTVVNTMSVTGYTYVQVDTGEEVVWAAAPQANVQVGDEVYLAGASAMPKFYSASLDRHFEMIYFAPTLRVTSDEPAATLNLGDHCPPGKAGADELDGSGIARAEGGKTIGEIYASKHALAGQVITFRGQVVKCSSGILGRNWIHLRDGTSGPEGAVDLTVTTDAVVAVGTTLLVQGIVGVDKDFGYGYKYDLLIEDASVTVE